jgi:hypothetical protein
MGMQADGGLVEDVGHICQAGAEVAHHLDALRFAAGQGGGHPVQAEIAEADVDQAVQSLGQRGDHRGDGRVVDGAYELREGLYFHGGTVGDVPAVDQTAQCCLVEPGAAAHRAVFGRDDPFERGAHVRLHLVRALGDVETLELGEQALVGQVERAAPDVHLDLCLGQVEQRVPLLFAEVPQLLVAVKEPRSP